MWTRHNSFRRFEVLLNIGWNKQKKIWNSKSETWYFTFGPLRIHFCLCKFLQLFLPLFGQKTVNGQKTRTIVTWLGRIFWSPESPENFFAKSMFQNLLFRSPQHFKIWHCGCFPQLHLKCDVADLNGRLRENIVAAC